MGGMALFRRAVALLVVAGLFAVLVTGISADDGNEEAVAARVLEPPEVVAEIPEEYDTLFQVQWGGGSLFQLAGRLAAQGCAMNTLWVHDGRQWHPYNRYDVPREAALIQEFIRLYERDLPAGTFYATCADQPDTHNLQPTQIVAEIPEEYDTLFDLQWGGGSLLHLKGRLATMGCIANNISFSDPTTSIQHTYNQYNTRSTDPMNQQFTQTFERYVPAGAMQADCYNICEFKDERCFSPEETREYYDNQDFSNYDDTFDVRDRPCTDDFHPTVKEKILPILPIHPNTCIIRSKRGPGNNTAGFAIGDSINLPPAVVIFEGNHYYRSWTNEHNDILLHIEIHELCHVNQQWHWIQSLALDKPIDYSYNKAWRYFGNVHGKEFTRIVEYDTVISNNVPLDSPYRDIYGYRLRIELPAELCALHLLNKVGANSQYNYSKWSRYRDRFIRIPVRDFDTSPYLTPEIIEWLETYMILPDIEEGTEGATE